MVRKRVVLLLISALFLFSCSGATSIVKKSWKNSNNFLAIVDMTSNGGSFMDAGSMLRRALEETLMSTNFVVSDEPAKYKLKYKIVDYIEGNRWKRMAAIGALSRVGQSKLTVQAALFYRKKLVGRWDIESWLNDGLLGGTEDILFKKAAHKIIEHLKGDH